MDRGRKLAAAFAMALIGLTILGWVATVNLRSLAASQDVVVHSAEVLDVIDDVDLGLGEMRAGLLGYVAAGNDSYLDAIQDGQERVTAAVASMRELIDVPAIVPLIDDVAGALADYDTFATEIVETFDRDATAAAQMLDDGAGIAAVDAVHEHLSEIDAGEAAFMQERVDTSRASATRATSIIVLVAVAVFAVTGMLATVVVRRIVGPLRRAVDVLCSTSRPGRSSPSSAILWAPSPSLCAAPPVARRAQSHCDADSGPSS